ncbi:uncharacterized protein LOC127286480 [Leptopilina boulardi]|uniref:uncharacterized protein LOC127286480 n=1 Tax=Leptopilina boulardi TaxID=63433 RepID=UPI0021F577FE|nr:uncharacterized protein LOC127286480 [Leptopilina boulardi]
MTTNIINLIIVTFFVINLQYFIESKKNKKTSNNDENVNNDTTPCNSTSKLKELEKYLHNYKDANFTIDEENSDIATLNCKVNYTLRGDSTIYCIDGEWITKNASICYHKDCLNTNSPHFTIENGEILPSYGAFGIVYLDYTCNENYIKAHYYHYESCMRGKIFGTPNECLKGNNLNFK